MLYDGLAVEISVAKKAALMHFIFLQKVLNRIVWVIRRKKTTGTPSKFIAWVPKDHHSSLSPKETVSQ